MGRLNIIALMKKRVKTVEMMEMMNKMKAKKIVKNKLFYNS
jgi:hypothetical protein